MADLYAGVGTFTLPMARLAGSVTAVEGSRHALGDLRRNLERAGVDADVAPGDAARVLPELGYLDAVLVDLPGQEGIGDGRPRGADEVEDALLHLAHHHVGRGEAADADALSAEALSAEAYGASEAEWADPGPAPFTRDSSLMP